MGEILHHGKQGEHRNWRIIITFENAKSYLSSSVTCCLRCWVEVACSDILFIELPPFASFECSIYVFLSLQCIKQTLQKENVCVG